VQREVEDLAAVLEVAGGPAAVFGYSSGGVLALHAATTLPITHLFLYEAPFGLAPAADLADRLEALIRQDRPGDAVALFQTEGIGLPPQMVEQIRRSPMFPALEAIAQSTVYEATLNSQYANLTAEMKAVDVPTLVLTGADTWPVLVAAAKAVPTGRHVEVPGAENHDIPVPETAAIVRDFLTVNNP
jgi:pimeloyl-ACP methyl ester carboxylesterase